MLSLDGFCPHSWAVDLCAFALGHNGLLIGQSLPLVRTRMIDELEPNGPLFHTFLQQ